MHDPPSVLRLVNSVEHTSAPYNQFTIPAIELHNIRMCGIFPSGIKIDERIMYDHASGNPLAFIAIVRRLLRTQSFDVIHLHSVHVAFLFTIAALLGRPSAIRRSVIHIHTSYPNYTARNRFLAFLAFLTVPRIVFCSSSSRDSFPWLFRWLSGSRHEVICNGVNIDRVDMARQERVSSKPVFRVLSVGALRPLKNHVATLQAFAQAGILNSHLTIVGGGPQLKELKDEAGRLGIKSKVTFTGRVSRDAVLSKIWDSDLFISMSHCEGLPVAVMESMAGYCPVVLSDIPPHRELLTGNLSDEIVAVNDTLGLARKIKRFESLSEVERIRIGQACRDRVEAEFSLRQMLDRYSRLFADVSRSSKSITRNAAA